MGRLVVWFLAAAALLAVTSLSHAQSRCAKISFAAERAKLVTRLRQLQFSKAQIAYAETLVARKAKEFPADLLTPNGRSCGVDAITGAAIGCMVDIFIGRKQIRGAKPLDALVDVPPSARRDMGRPRATAGELLIFGAATICFAAAADHSTTAE